MVIFQCYDSQSNLLSSFDFNCCKLSPTIMSTNHWFERNTDVVCLEGTFLKTFDKFGVLQYLVSLPYFPCSANWNNPMFSLIHGVFHKFDFCHDLSDSRFGLTIKNHNKSWRYQDVHVKVSISSGTCAKLSVDENVVSFNCFY